MKRTDGKGRIRVYGPNEIRAPTAMYACIGCAQTPSLSALPADLSNKAGNVGVVTGVMHVECFEIWHKHMHSGCTLEPDENIGRHDSIESIKNWETSRAAAVQNPAGHIQDTHSDASEEEVINDDFEDDDDFGTSASNDVPNLPDQDMEEVVQEYTCCICLDEEKVDVALAKTPCGHIFHRKCIDNWMRVKGREKMADRSGRLQKPNCPKCRKAILPRAVISIEEENNDSSEQSDDGQSDDTVSSDPRIIYNFRRIADVLGHPHAKVVVESEEDFKKVESCFKNPWSSPDDYGRGLQPLQTYGPEPLLFENNHPPTETFNEATHLTVLNEAIDDFGEREEVAKLKRCLKSAILHQHMGFEQHLENRAIHADSLEYISELERKNTALEQKVAHLKESNLKRTVCCEALLLQSNRQSEAYLTLGRESVATKRRMTEEHDADIARFDKFVTKTNDDEERRSLAEFLVGGLGVAQDFALGSPNVSSASAIAVVAPTLSSAAAAGASRIGLEENNKRRRTE